MWLFRDRKDAGKKLSEKLKEYENDPRTIVLGLARGGVVVAAEAARLLHLPLDIVVVRKVGAPDNEELAIGAVADEGKGVFNEDLIALLGVSRQYLHHEVLKQRELVKKRLQLYLQGRTSPSLKAKTVILIDDGIATGASMRVAIEAVKAKQPAKIVLAVPVAASDSLSEVGKLVDQAICLSAPSYFQAVGAFYEYFEQTTDTEIINLMDKILS